MKLPTTRPSIWRWRSARWSCGDGSLARAIGCPTSSTRRSLQRVDIDLHTADWAKLKQNFQTNEYYPADMRWNGIKAYNAGVRRAASASRKPEQAGAAGSISTTTRAGQTFLGLKSLVLDNLVQDPSGVHETRRCGSSRASASRRRARRTRVVYVNGDYAGVYAMVEPIDKNMIARVFGNEVDGRAERRLPVRIQQGRRVVAVVSRARSSIAYKRYFGAKTHETRAGRDALSADRKRWSA